MNRPLCISHLAVATRDLDGMVGETNCHKTEFDSSGLRDDIVEPDWLERVKHALHAESAPPHPANPPQQGLS